MGTAVINTHWVGHVRWAGPCAIWYRLRWLGRGGSWLTHERSALAHGAAAWLGWDAWVSTSGDYPSGLSTPGGADSAGEPRAD